MGGSSKAPTPQPVTQTTTTELPPQARELFDMAMPSLRQWAANPPQMYQGSQVAGFDPAQVQGQNMALEAATPQGQIVSGAGGAINRMTSGELLDPNSNPALRATIDASTRPIIDDLLTKALPNIRGGAQVSGNYGGSRQDNAEIRAVEAASRAAGDTAAKVATTGYGQGLEAMTKGTALAPSIAGSQVLPAQTTSAVGDVRQAQAQSELGDTVNQWNYAQNLPLLTGQTLASIAAGIPGGTTSTQGQMYLPQQNTLMQGLGLGISGLGALGALGGTSGIAGLAPLLTMF